MVAHATRFFVDLSLGPGDERVETSVQIPEGFTPEMLEIEPTPDAVKEGMALMGPANRAIHRLKAMHCSLLVAVRFDDELIFQAPFGHLPARLSAGEARNLTILIERHDRPGTRDREQRVERDETWRMRAWISGMQEGYAATGPLPLAAPDGTVYCWACSTCHHIAAGTVKIAQHAPEDVAELAVYFRHRAEVCCRCRKCGGPAPRYTEQRVNDVCAACWEGGERQAEEARTAEWAAHREAEETAYNASVARSPDPGAALMLEHEMRDLSEDHYCAGWMSGLEYTLWRAVTTEPMVAIDYGIGVITLAELQSLRELSGKAGGWWTHRRFVPMDEWVAHFREHAPQLIDEVER